jgi:hypothetical protein
MGKYEKSGEVPATSQKSYCAHLCDGENKCGKEAHNIIEALVEVMGKLIRVKKLVCDNCLETMRDPNANYSIGESK